MKTKTTTLSTQARALLALLKRNDIDNATVEPHVYEELRASRLANVIFSATGNRCFATSAGRAVAL